MCTSINMRADNFAIIQILIENKCCLVNVYDLIVTTSETEMSKFWTLGRFSANPRRLPLCRLIQRSWVHLRSGLRSPCGLGLSLLLPLSHPDSFRSGRGTAAGRSHSSRAKSRRSSLRRDSIISAKIPMIWRFAAAKRTIGERERCSTSFRAGLPITTSGMKGSTLAPATTDGGREGGFPPLSASLFLVPLLAHSGDSTGDTSLERILIRRYFRPASVTLCRLFSCRFSSSRLSTLVFACARAALVASSTPNRQTRWHRHACLATWALVLRSKLIPPTGFHFLALSTLSRTCSDRTAVWLASHAANFLVAFARQIRVTWSSLSTEPRRSRSPHRTGAAHRAALSAYPPPGLGPHSEMGESPSGRPSPFISSMIGDGSLKGPVHRPFAGARALQRDQPSSVASSSKDSSGRERLDPDLTEILSIDVHRTLLFASTDQSFDLDPRRTHIYIYILDSA